MTRARRWFAVLTVLTMVGAPASALAVHSRCEISRHACSGTATDVCCCRLVRPGDTPPATNAPLTTGVVAVASLAVDLSGTAPLEVVVHAVRPRPAGAVADRLTLFKVLLI